jgi:hypothetical protein
MKKFTARPYTKKGEIDRVKAIIEWYGVRKSIANAMLKLADMGFQYTGYEPIYGGEMFSFANLKRNLHVNFCDHKRCVVVVQTANRNDDLINLFTGGIAKSLDFIHAKCNK